MSMQKKAWRVVDRRKYDRNWLRWFRQVMRKEKSKTIEMVMEINVDGKTGRGRPKKRFLDAIESDMRTASIRVNDVKGSYQVEV